MQTTPGTMMNERWYCSNDVKVAVLVDLNVWVLLLGIDYSGQYQSNV